MDEKAKEARREYYRKWRKKNKDKIKKYNSNYWKKKGTVRKASDKED